MSRRTIYRDASPTERIYVATQTIVVSRSGIVGKVDREQFESAVAHLEARYGILRSVVEDGRFVERADAASSVAAWLPGDLWSADLLYEKLLNAALDTQSRVYEIHVIAAEDALDVFMLSSHAITDATSLVELHAFLAHACDCTVRSATPESDAQPFPTPVDEAVDKALAAVPADRAGTSDDYSGSYAEIPLPVPHGGGSLTHGLDRMVIEADGMHRISAACHAHGASVHALVLAAFAVAIGAVADGGPRRILMRSSVDMRRRLEPHVSPELVFSAITGHITAIPDLDQPLFDIAKLIFDELHEGVANGSIFRDYVNYPRSFGSPQQAPVALNISDMQSVHFRWSLEKLRVGGFEYALGWLKRFPNVSVSIYDGRLIANTVFVKEFVAPQTMRKISDNVVEILLSAGRSA